MLLARTLALCLVTAAFAGCLNGEEDPADAQTSAGGASATASAGGASASASGSSATASSSGSRGNATATTSSSGNTATATATSAPANQTKLVDVPLSFEGQIANHVCAPSGPNSCNSLPVGGGGNSMYEHEAIGAPQSLEATLTWTAATPASEHLAAYVVAVVSCGENCWEGRLVGDIFSGTSPITLSIASLDLQEGESLAIHVTEERVASPPDPVYFYATVEQSFLLEGKVVEEQAA